MNRRDLLKALPAVAVTPCLSFGQDGLKSGQEKTVEQPWQEELIKDSKWLRGRIEKLARFILKDPVFATLSPEDQNGLKRVLAFMKQLEIGLQFHTQTDVDVHVWFDYHN